MPPLLDQLNVALWPELMVVALVVKLQVTVTGVVTVTVTLLTHFESRSTVSLYVVVDEGDTTVLPLEALEE